MRVAISNRKQRTAQFKLTNHETDPRCFGNSRLVSQRSLTPSNSQSVLFSVRFAVAFPRNNLNIDSFLCPFAEFPSLWTMSDREVSARRWARESAAVKNRIGPGIVSRLLTCSNLTRVLRQFRRPYRTLF